MLRTAQRVYSGTAKPGMRKNFTPLELVEAVEQSLMEDEALIKFNYTGFHARCRALLNNIYYGGDAAAARLLDSNGGPTGNDGVDNSAAAELVHATLWKAADLEKSKQGWRAKFDTTLAAFAHIMRNMILLDNDPYLAVARAGSSGHIAEKDRPCNLWKWGGDQASEEAVDEDLSTDDLSEKAKVDQILNDTCAKYRSWLDQDWTTEQRLRKTQLWADKELKKGGHNTQVRQIDLVPEYGQILISLKSTKKDIDTQALQEAFQRVMNKEELQELPDLLPGV